MDALTLAARLGTSLVNNKVRHPVTGVVLARFEGDQLVLTSEGSEIADSLPAKTTRAAEPATVESPQPAPVVEAPAAEAVEAVQPDATPAE